ncbi:unnamed protein product [Zymoseptoria tritici ST99CH_3D1]|nr:unnamed protein product [Zymoseptoria tritici ST99CH_3D1]
MCDKAQTHATAMSKGVAWDLDVLDVFVLFGSDMSKSSLALDALRVLALDVHAPDFAVAMAEIRSCKRKRSGVVLPRLSKTAPFTAWDERGALATICGKKRREWEIRTKATKRWKAGRRGVASVGGEGGEDAGSVGNNPRDRAISAVATSDQTHGHDEITSARRASTTGGSQGDGNASTELTAAGGERDRNASTEIIAVGGERNRNASTETTAAGGERNRNASINGDVFDNTASAGGEAMEEDEDDGAEDVEQVRTAAGPLSEDSPGPQQEEHDDSPVSGWSDYYPDPAISTCGFHLRRPSSLSQQSLYDVRTPLWA